MQKGKPFPFAPEQVEEGTLRVNPETNRTQTYHNGEWKDNVITTPWSSGETFRNNNGQQEVYLDGKWGPLRKPKWYENIKEEDWYTLGSIVGDLAGLGLGAFGLSVPAALSGMASTTSQLIGDIKRDGFQAKDLGWAALGYGLDAATFIPGLGEVAQSAKLSKKVATYAPYILKTFGGVMSGLGMASALPTLEKATRGEKLTMDDYRALTNGLMGIIGLKNTISSKVAPQSNGTNGVDNSSLPVRPTTADRMRDQESRASEFFEETSRRYAATQAALRQQQRNYAATGMSKSDRNRKVKPHPLAGTAPETALKNLMLINRVGGSGQIEWQNGMLMWPHQKVYTRSLYDGSPLIYDRPSVHFTTHQAVQSHGSGSWDGRATTIMFPYATAIEHNGTPSSIEPMDTWFNNSTSFRIPASKILVFTGDVKEASRARLNGANVTFSPKVGIISKKLTAIEKEIDALHRINGGYDIPEWGSPEHIRMQELSKQKHQLEDEMQKLHNDFISSHQTAPTYEDYMQLEKETRLYSGVGTHQNPIGFGEKQPDGLTYSHDPRGHGNSWYGTNEAAQPRDQIELFLTYLDWYILNPSKWGSPEPTKQVINELIGPGSLVTLQQKVQMAIKSDPEFAKQLQKVAEKIPVSIPELAQVKRILSGERTYKWKSGGSLHIKKENRGKFTASAKRAGKSVQEHAKDVVNNPNSTELQRKRAQFALNAKKFKHEEGGKLNYLNYFN